MLAAHDVSEPLARHGLSPLQAGMLFHHLREPASASDVQQVVLQSRATLDLERLRRAWLEVVERHDVFRTAYRWSDERPEAIVRRSADVPFLVDERPNLDSAARDAAIEHALRDERGRLDHAQGRLCRVRAVRFAPDDVAIVWTNHHMILDGRSRSIVLGEIARRYAGEPLDAPPVSFSRHIAWLEEQRADDAAPFWRAYLDGVHGPTPLPPSARSESAGPFPAETREAVRELSADETSRLRAFAERAGCTVHTLVQAGWALVLARCAQVDDVVFGEVRACRRSGLADGPAIVGPLINTLPLRLRVDEDLTVERWLQHVQDRWQSLRAVEHTPLTDVATWARVQPGQLFASLVVFEHDTLAARLRTSIDPDDRLGIAGARVIDRTTYPLTLAAAGTERLELRLGGRADRYDDADTIRLLDLLVTALGAFPACAGAPVREVSLTGERQRDDVLGFNHTSDFPRDATIHELFAEIVARRPDATAAQLGDATLTYRELADRASDVAWRLRAAGVGRGDFVGLCVERSFDMLAALLGIVQAGAASVALDPAHPGERLAFMLAEAGAQRVLGQRHVLERLDEALERAGKPAAISIAIEDIARTAEPFVPDPLGNASDGAHVMYTSGSTGLPKGAVLPHRAIVRTVRGADYLEFSDRETFFAFVPLTFDVAVLEIWGPLLNGARLVICPPGLPSLDVLGATIAERGVTTLWLTTALFEHMIDEQLANLRGLHQLIVGGDVMSPSHARRFIEAVPHARFLNVCGPTEATVLIVAQHLRTPPHRPIPIGAPIANARVYILDPQRRPVPIGVPGELYTGEDGLALGYINRPDLTAERFVPNPFNPEPDARMYRTGDLGRWNADGSIVSLGRIDTQLKISGVRIEPGEVESALNEHPAVREAVVVAAGAATGEKVLVAYVVPETTATPDGAAIRTFLAARLPAAMVPAHVAFIDAIPLTPTGKFDRKALPAVAVPSRAGGGSGRRPESAIATAIAVHVEELLDRRDVMLDDDFFAVGGDSLRAMRLVGRLRSVFGVDLSIRDVLAASTIDGMAATIARLQHGAVASTASLVTVLRASGTKAPFVFLHGDLAGGGRYCNELLPYVDPERPIFVVAPNGSEARSVPPASIRAAAQQNIAALAAHGVTGPLTLGGFCNGGTVAYEMARQYARAGITVERVIMIDAVPRNVHPSMERLARLAVRAVLARLGLGHVRRTRSPGATASWEAWHEFVLERWRYAVAEYRAGRFAGPVTLIWSDDHAIESSALTATWQTLAPLAHADRIAGTHLTTITRYVAQTCASLGKHVG